MRTKDLINQLNTIDENVKIEAKRCSNKIDKSVLESVCAFSNEPDLDGGTILIGVSESEDPDINYEITGIEESDRLQKDLATQCRERFNHPVRPTIIPENVDGKNLLIVNVPELDKKLKPLYFKNEKLPSGAWRRIGSSDQQCTDEDLIIFYSDADTFDKAICQDTDLSDIDENAVKRYRQLREKANPSAEELQYDDIDLLKSLKAIKKDRDGSWKLTNTGLIVFGKQMALRRELPAVRVDYIRVPGTEWISDPHNRFDSVDMRGPMMLMVTRAFNAISEDLPRGFSIAPGSLQANRPLSIPADALREAIVNALIHQSFRSHRPIQIIRYTNRIEITNAGFSLKPEETLGEPGSEMRNPTIGSIFHETQIAEAKGTGIGTMRKLMKEAGMFPPTFESDRARNIFTTRILLHHFMSPEDLVWFKEVNIPDLSDSQKTALIFLREIGAIDNLTYRQLSGLNSKKASYEVKQLEKLGLLIMKGHGRKTYYIPSPKLLDMYNRDGFKNTSPTKFSEPNVHSPEPNVHSSEPNVHSSEPNVHSSIQDILKVLPDDLNYKLKTLKKKVDKKILKSLIIELCSVSPLDSDQLSLLLKRNKNHLRRRILSELINEKKVNYLYPEMINHPQQKFKTIVI